MEHSILDMERAKFADTLPKMNAYFEQHPEALTPYADRWLDLCVEHMTQIYAAKPLGAAPGRRLRYGTPVRLVECIESAEKFGPDKRGVWFVKVVGA